MPQTVSCDAELTVNLALAPALALFTAEGERAWAPGWDPEFPAKERTEGVGSVFVTTADDATTTWVMVDQDDHGVRYARLTEGLTAGMVAVTVLESTSTQTRLQVRYDLTALSAEGARWLQEFADEYAAYIESWEVALTAATKRTPA